MTAKNAISAALLFLCTLSIVTHSKLPENPTFQDYLVDIPDLMDDQIRLAESGKLILVVHFTATETPETLRALKGYHRAISRISKKIDFSVKCVKVDC